MSDTAAASGVTGIIDVAIRVTRMLTSVFMPASTSFGAKAHRKRNIAMMRC
jgi:hypothetical protein